MVLVRFAADGYKAVQVPEPLFHYRQTGASMSLPWSEGQGALTVSRVCEVVREAAAAGRLYARQVAQIAEQAIALAYKRTWQCDVLRSQQAARPVAAPAPANTEMYTAYLYARRAHMRARLASLFGDRNTTRLLNLVRQIIRNHLLAGTLAGRCLAFGRLNRPDAASGEFLGSQSG